MTDLVSVVYCPAMWHFMLLKTGLLCSWDVSYLSSIFLLFKQEPQALCKGMFTVSPLASLSLSAGQGWWWIIWPPQCFVKFCRREMKLFSKFCQESCGRADVQRPSCQIQTSSGIMADDNQQWKSNYYRMFQPGNCQICSFWNEGKLCKILTHDVYFFRFH